VSRGFGVAAGLDPEVAAPLAERCAALGYDSVWSNDTPLGSGLETLSSFADGSDSVGLGVAVLAIDRHEPEAIAAKIDELGLPRERLWIGVGAGFSPKPLTAMRAALPRLRDALGGTRLVLAAMGPKMCAFGGGEFDGVFFNWMTPAFAASARAHVERGAAEANRQPPPIFGYVRTAVGPDAAERLVKEESFYRDYHDGYRNHFARLGEPEGTVGVAAADRDEAQAALGAYEALDVTVVRALASARLDAMAELAAATAPPSYSSGEPGPPIKSR
jgi:alkanesulfonate monooxygenase SsuD/methylene tetrahydromethanopterin reductase-like flavin-dependent oxidoreductase (luciferase family)